MKKILTPILLFLLLWNKGTYYQAGAEVLSCEPGNGYVDYGETEFANYGFQIVNAQKVSPRYPIAIGQDENQTGVNISLEIRSLPGTISYEILSYRQECDGYMSYQPNLEERSCAPTSGGMYFYWTEVPYCALHTETVYRHIQGTSLKVWLDPDPDTEAWLGWADKPLGGRYPLRDMFPEKWLLGWWTPDGYTGVSDPGLWDQGDIDQFIEDNPGFDFLKGDPRHETIPTNALLRVTDPMVSTTGETDPFWAQSYLGGDRRVLGLFGSFNAWPGDSRYGSQPGQCLIRMATLTGGNGYCDMSPDFWSEQLTDLRIDFLHAPLDLPGNWRIGISVHVSPASYNGGLIEKIDNSNFLFLDPSNGYSLDDHSFLSYILLTTPCNSPEAHACTQ